LHVNGAGAGLQRDSEGGGIAALAPFSRFERRRSMEDNNAKAYWSATLGLLSKVLVIWAVVSYGAGILFAPALNAIHLGGYPLGFWFAQQGSIYIFIALIFWYAKKMKEIDREFGMQED
jgi:putative solute:sodium symporter small subunit